MPSEPHEVARCSAAHLDQRLGGRHHFDEAPVVEQKRVSTPQRHRIGEVEQELQPSGARHGDAAAMAIVEMEHDGVGQCGSTLGFGPLPLGQDCCGADQAIVLTTEG